MRSSPLIICKKACIAALGAFCMMAASAQGTLSSPDESVKNAVETVVKAAQADPAAKDGNVDAMSKVVRREFLPYTDFERTTRLAVGAAWNGMTDGQRQRLVQLFTQLLVHVYALQLTQLHDQNIRFSFDPASIDTQGNDALVRSGVKGLDSGDDMQIRYRLTKAPDGWRIYDLDIGGLWLIQLYRKQLGDQIAKGGPDGLIKYLADHNARFGK